MSIVNASLGIEHTSDLSYIVRAVCAVYAFIWLAYKVSSGGFAALRSINPKSIITSILFMALLLEIFFNVVATKIKYTEGLYYAALAEEIIPKPEKLWSNADKSWVDLTDYILAITLGLQACALFLLPWFWNDQSTSIANMPLMSPTEIRVYVIWAIFSVPMLPALAAWLKTTTNGVLDKEVFPRLVYASQLALLVVLGLTMHFRLARLTAQTGKDAQQIVAKMQYLTQMNGMLAIALLVTAVGSFTLYIDVMTSHVINKNKFLSDLLLVNIHITTFIQWILLALILYPTKGFGGGISLSNIQSIYIDREKPGSLQGSPRRETIPLPESPKHAPGYSQVPPGIELRAATPTPDMSVSGSASVSASVSASSASASPSPLPAGSLLKRNLSVSKDGRMVYADTKPLSKVGGSEFIAVEKVDPSTIPSYYFTQDDGKRQSLPAPPRDAQSPAKPKPSHQQQSDVPHSNSPTQDPSYCFPQDGSGPLKLVPATTASVGHHQNISGLFPRNDSALTAPKPSHQQQPGEPFPNSPVRQISMPTMSGGQQVQQHSRRSSVHSRDSSRSSVTHARRYSQQTLQQLLHNQQQKIHQQQHKSVVHQQYRSHSRQSTQRLSSGLMLQEYTTTSLTQSNQHHNENLANDKRASQLSSVSSPPTEVSFAMSDSTLSTPRVAFDGTPITITTTTTTFVSTDAGMLPADPNARINPLALRSMTPVTDASGTEEQSVSNRDSNDYSDANSKSGSDRESYSRDTPTPTPRSIRNVEDAHDHGRPETPPRAPPSRLGSHSKGADYDRNLPSPTVSSSSRQSHGETGSEATSYAGDYFYAM